MHRLPAASGQGNQGPESRAVRRFFPHASRVEAQRFVEDNMQAETMAEFQGLLLGRESRINNSGQSSLELEADVCEVLLS